MWFQQPDAFTHVQFVWNVAQTSSWSVLRDRIYITKRMKWPDVNSPYNIFMLFFIKMKLSSRLCLTHKRVTQKYRNSTLIKKKKPALGSDRIGIGRYSEFSGSDRIWKNGIVASLVLSLFLICFMSKCKVSCFFLCFVRERSHANVLFCFVFMDARCTLLWLCACSNFQRNMLIGGLKDQNLLVE